MSTKWVSPIYIFFRPTPRIEYVEGRHCHVFECAAGQCRAQNGRDVRRFLNKGDGNSTGNLHRHAKCCWGEEAVESAAATRDLAGAREILEKSKLCDGSITSEFARIGKGKVTFSHRQHTKTESRYVTYLLSWSWNWFDLLSLPKGRDHPLGRRKQVTFQDCQRSRFREPYEDWPTRVFHTFTWNSLSWCKEGVCACTPVHCQTSAGQISFNLSRSWNSWEQNQEHDGALSFATDAWTSPNDKAFVAVTVHFEQKGVPVSFLLDLVELATSHSGYNLVVALAKIFEEFGISDKVRSKSFSIRIQKLTILLDSECHGW